MPISKMALMAMLRMQVEAIVLPLLKMAAPIKMTGVCLGERGSRRL